MGFDCPLNEKFKFHYKVVLDNGLIENEIDAVFIGNYGGEININKNEVSDYKWIPIQKLKGGNHF
jgi:isopentenyl-diphosphate delta-isomerase